MRECASCDRTGIPRHVVGLLNAAPGTPPPAPVHIDCHAAAGCPSCQADIAAAGGRLGLALAEYLAAERAVRTLEDTNG